MCVGGHRVVHGTHGELMKAEDNFVRVCSPLYPFTKWDPGIDLRSAGLGAGTFTH